MKKFILSSTFILGLLSLNFANADIVLLGGASGVLCTSGNRICTVGKYTMSTNGTEPLIVENGVVCTPDRRMCTNGFYTLYSKGARYF